MGHHITAIILKGDYDKIKAEKFDLFGKEIGFHLTLFHIDHCQTAYWQYQLKLTGKLETYLENNFIFPTEIAIAAIVKQISKEDNPEYALIQTDYFGGIGKQSASVYQNETNVSKNIKTINPALAYLGVIRLNELDEFDSVGLDKIRSQPDIFEKYSDLADEFGL